MKGKGIGLRNRGKKRGEKRKKRMRK